MELVQIGGLLGALPLHIPSQILGIWLVPEPHLPHVKVLPTVTSCTRVPRSHALVQSSDPVKNSSLWRSFLKHHVTVAFLATGRFFFFLEERRVTDPHLGVRAVGK